MYFFCLTVCVANSVKSVSSFSICSHPFAGATGVSDVLLKVQHSGIPDGGRRLLTAVTSTGKYFSERGMKVKSSISSWFQGSGTSKTGAS